MIVVNQRPDCYTTSSYQDDVSILVIKVLKLTKLAFPLCSQNLLKIDKYAVQKFINPISTVILARSFCLQDWSYDHK